MSLLEFVKLREVSERLKPFRLSPRKFDWPRKVAPTPGIDVRLTGRAFDYLLRFELQRRAKHAKDGRWIALHAEQWFPYDVTPGEWKGPKLLNLNAAAALPDPFDVSQRIMTVCWAAQRDHAVYIKNAAPTREDRSMLAGHAVRLAKLDDFHRAYAIDVTFEHADPRLIDELVEMLLIAPYEKLVTTERMLLNPTFGDASRQVRGGDADLILGDMLVDIKTTDSSYPRLEHLDQLLGYFLLARRAGIALNRVGLYYSRYGEMRSCPTSSWVARSGFLDTEKWFFERAEKEYPQPKPSR